jgi:DNA topoisomerase-1
MTRTLLEHFENLDSSLVREAEVSQLRYTSDKVSGIRRSGSGKRFVYYDARGRRVRSPIILRRIKALAVPPAWTQVWISSFPDSHLQAVGRDARGRKQFRYHSRWREIREQTKYDRLTTVGAVLPRLRARVAEDLSLRGLPREKVVATIVRLLETTFIRIGNGEYARQNQSFGLTTLRNKHVNIRGSSIRFRFRGKSGIARDTILSDRRLAQIVRRCQELPGQELFQYIDDRNRCRAISSGDVNDYLRGATGIDLTAKDFRTWAGTVLAAVELAALEAAPESSAKRNIVKAVEQVSKKLGNTRAVCRKSYIHPAIIDSYLDGTLRRTMPRQEPRGAVDPHALTPEEVAVIKVLRRAGAAQLSGKRAA